MGLSCLVEEVDGRALSAVVPAPLPGDAGGRDTGQLQQEQGPAAPAAPAPAAGEQKQQHHHHHEEEVVYGGVGGGVGIARTGSQRWLVGQAQAQAQGQEAAATELEEGEDRTRQQQVQPSPSLPAYPHESGRPPPALRYQDGDEDDWIISRDGGEGEDEDDNDEQQKQHQQQQQQRRDPQGLRQRPPLHSAGGGGPSSCNGDPRPATWPHPASSPGLTMSESLTPSSPTNSMGRKRLSFTRMDNLPQVRVDLQHLYYFAGRSSRFGGGSWLQRRLRPQLLSSPSLPKEDGGATEAPILNDVSLSLTPGQLLGVMGPSGSGKTSLLRVLHGARKYTRNVQGTVLVNGTPVRNIHSAFRKMCSLVPQEDILLPTFTVYETLMFGAELRLPQGDTREERRETVESVIAELALEDCRDVVIGSVEKAGGVSGGQRRRISIGLELLTDPSVLLLDEPTSGLDSKTAEDICALLQQLAGPDRCVCASIHQPSYHVFVGCFDRFLFLVKGRVAYDGPPGRLGGFFARLGFEPPPYENPADYYLRVLQEEADVVVDGWRRKQERDAAEALLAAPPLPPSTAVAAAAPAVAGGGGGGGSNAGQSQPGASGSRGSFGSASSLRALGLGLPPLSVSSSLGGGGGGGGNGSASASGVGLASRHGSSDSLVLHGGEVLMLDREATWLGETDMAQQHNSLTYQFAVLLRRALADTCKDRRKLLTGFAMEIFTGLVVGLVWFQQDVYTQGSIFPICGVLCMLVTIAVFDSFIGLVLTFPLTRALHFREYNNGYYCLLPYFLASVMATALTSGAYQLCDFAIVFFMVGMPFSWLRVVAYLGILLLGTCIGAAIGFLVGTFTSDMKRMQSVVVPVLLPMLIFSGYMIPLEAIPAGLKWAYHASFYQYIYSSLAINHFHNLTFRDCPPEAAATGACRHQGDEVLQAMHLPPDLLGRNIAILVGVLGLLLCAGYGALRLKSQ